MTDFIEINTNFDPRADALLASPKSSLLVAILLCTYNGARFLGEKLDSLEAQMHQNWVLVASEIKYLSEDGRYLRNDNPWAIAQKIFLPI